MKRFSGIRVAGPVAGLTLLAAMSAPTQAQVAVGLDLAAPIAPLNAIAVPDVNMLGILDAQGNPGVLGADQWPVITQPNRRTDLQRLGKALFWDMQVGGDGVQACATCHYHAGADNRAMNQLSPGIKQTVGGVDLAAKNPDPTHDLAGPNALLVMSDFLNAGPNPGVPVSEARLQALGWQPDSPAGEPGLAGANDRTGVDVNDVVSSQGIRLGQYEGLSGGAVDAATLSVQDAGFDRDTPFPTPAVLRNSASVESVHTFRRVEPRNSPTAMNAVYHLRNFWDGRADTFFNGVNPLGFRDPGAQVKVFTAGALGNETLRVPFSSLASQAVGPIGSMFEMVFGDIATDSGRPSRDLGKKLLADTTIPLAGQAVSATDPLLGGSLTTGRGLTRSYKQFIKDTFDQRFWGNGAGEDVCLDAADPDVPVVVDCVIDLGAGLIANPAADYTLMEWNFALFFGLAVQAYEATLTTEQTIVDLLVGGIATGSVINGTGRTQRIVPVAGLPLDACIARVATSNRANQQLIATNLCAQHYASFVHPDARSGSESAVATAALVPVVGNNQPIGGCGMPAPGATRITTSTGTRDNGAECKTIAQLANGRSSLQAINRGVGRFFAGATGCGICHFNPEFTGATVAALTGFGAAPPPPLPPGQVRRVPLEVPMERMIAFNGQPAVYDAGFYNLGVRPTAEDLSLGDQIGGVPLAYTKLAELIAVGGTPPAPYDGTKIAAIKAELDINPATGLNSLLIPTSTTNLAPRPFTLALACGPGLVGGGNANNNPIQNCVPNIIPGERLLRNGAFKAQGLRNVKFTGPYLHNGSKVNLRQVVEFYETAGHMPNLSLNNLDAGLRIFQLNARDDASLVEMMETGLTDWRLAYEEGKFSHPEICVPHGHNSDSGATTLVGIPAVGAAGYVAGTGTTRKPLSTFQDVIENRSDVAHTLNDPCTMMNPSAPGDVPPAPATP